jgi:hypothetical protein
MSSEEMKAKPDEIGACGCRLHELRRHRLGELTGADRERVSAHVAACETCRARLAALEAEQQSFLAKTDIATESARILERLEQREAAAEQSLAARIIAFIVDPRRRPAIALALVLLFIAPIALIVQPERRGNRTKGSVALEMFVNAPNGPRLASNGERLKEGDQIQFRYRAAGKRYVFVVSVAGQGALEPLYPDTPAKSIPISPDGMHVLEGSVILDEVRGPERIFAFFSDRPLSFEEVKAALDAKLKRESDITALQEVDLEREDVDEASVLIVKE